MRHRVCNTYSGIYRVDLGSRNPRDVSVHLGRVRSSERPECDDDRVASLSQKLVRDLLYTRRVYGLNARHNFRLQKRNGIPGVCQTL